VTGLERQNDGRLVVERRGIRRYVCAGCGRRTGHVRDAKARTWDDLPWADPVTLRYTLRRLWCRPCGIRTERVAFAHPHARLTRRFRQRIGLDGQSMPTSHAAVRHAVSWGTARRAERAFLEAWDRARPNCRPRHLGVDEIQRGKGQYFWTVLSDLVRGEVNHSSRWRRLLCEGLRPWQPDDYVDRDHDGRASLITRKMFSRWVKILRKHLPDSPCLPSETSRPHSPTRCKPAESARAQDRIVSYIVRAERHPLNRKPKRGDRASLLTPC